MIITGYWAAIIFQSTLNVCACIKTSWTEQDYMPVRLLDNWVIFIYIVRSFIYIGGKKQTKICFRFNFVFPFSLSFLSLYLFICLILFVPRTITLPFGGFISSVFLQRPWQGEHIHKWVSLTKWERSGRYLGCSYCKRELWNSDSAAEVESIIV